mmetsp:Transcript_19614/g.46628  ORF Transcript_19614/g.46628 Transcript_19614/m.46628 type:complete len:225 (-) Transcript_19614:174-848(-)
MVDVHPAWPPAPDFAVGHRVLLAQGHAQDDVVARRPGQPLRLDEVLRGALCRPLVVHPEVGRHHRLHQFHHSRVMPGHQNSLSAAHMLVDRIHQTLVVVVLDLKDVLLERVREREQRLVRARAARRLVRNRHQDGRRAPGEGRRLVGHAVPEVFCALFADLADVRTPARLVGVLHLLRMANQEHQSFAPRLLRRQALRNRSFDDHPQQNADCNSDADEHDVDCH